MLDMGAVSCLVMPANGICNQRPQERCPTEMYHGATQRYCGASRSACAVCQRLRELSVCGQTARYVRTTQALLHRHEIARLHGAYPTAIRPDRRWNCVGVDRRQTRAT